MKSRKTAETVLWLVLVYVFSGLCYLPAILKRNGAAVPQGLTGLGNGFVLVPAVVTVFFLIHARGLKAYGKESFKGISRKEMAVCLAAALAGVCCAGVYSFAKGRNLFAETFPSVLSFLASACYLFLTALAEEIAWRGFFLRRLAKEGKGLASLLPAGTAWAFWHIPMWTAHGLPVSQQVQLLLWAVLVSIVLGGLFLRCQNVFSTALCHMLFNVCFLAPVWINCLVLFCVLAVCGCVQSRKGAGRATR